MTKRLFAMAAVVVASLAGAGGPPAGAQSQPPPPAGIAVDDDTPTPGQAITVTMRTCPAGARALFGVDLVLVGSARAGADGVAIAAVTVPPSVVPGPHTVSGWCLGAGLRPLFLRTAITVVADQPAPAVPPPPPAQPDAAVPPPADHGAVVPPPDGGRGPGGAAGGLAPGGGSPTPQSVPAPSPDAPAGPALPTGAAAADGVPATAAPAPAANRAAPAGTDAAGPAARATPESGSDLGPLSTLARVALGLAAIAGVPVALAFSRGPRDPARRTRIPFLGGRFA